MAIGKRLKKAREGVNREKLYPLADAIKMVKERAKSKFDETVEIAINLGVDPRHADQMVRGVVTLPRRPRPPAPMSSVLKTWWKKSRAAPSISIDVSQPPT